MGLDLDIEYVLVCCVLPVSVSEGGPRARRRHGDAEGLYPRCKSSKVAAGLLLEAESFLVVELH